MDVATGPECPRCAKPTQGRRCEDCGAALAAGPYLVQKVLSEAGQSRTYLAKAANGELVFLKELIFLLVPDAKALEAFEREGELLKQLQHPNIPSYLAHFSEGDGKQLRLYLAERYIQGPSLLQELEKRRYSEEEVRQIAAQILAILVYLHRRTPAILHRDLKPANLIRRMDGQLALVDFGSARDAAVRGAQGATQSGTVGYAPPEQLAGIVTPASDVYALAATLLHLLTRKAPWEQLEAGFEPAIRGLGASKPFARWLLRALDPRIEKRFASAAEAAEALAARSSGLPGRLLQVAGGLAALAVVGGALVAGRQLLARPPPVHPELIAELCPEDGFLGGDATKEQFCQTRIGDKSVRNGPSVKYRSVGTGKVVVREISHYQDDVLDGAFVEYGYSEGADVQQEGNYVKGVRQGPWKTNQGEGNMVDGKLDGTWTAYFTKGVPREVTLYAMGRKDGPSTTYSSQGRKQLEASYKNDRLDGKHTRYHPNGKVQWAGAYAGGVQDGPFVEYTPEGKKKLTGSYSGGQQTGESIEYFPDESVSSVSLRSGGTLWSIKEFYQGGATRAVWTADDRTRRVSAVEYFEDGAKRLEAGPCEDATDQTALSCVTEYYKNGQVAAKAGTSGLSLHSRGRPRREGPSREWHENGALKSEGEYGFSGRRMGTWKTYWPNKRLQRLEMFGQDGQQDGDFKQYFENGQLQITGSWVRGQKKGIWIERATNGAVLSKQDLGR